MKANVFPTKGNLILVKNSLNLAKVGYELMDKKRNILLRELMDLISKAKEIQTQIDQTFLRAYQALEYANIEMGIFTVNEISQSIPIDTSIQIKLRSVMGTEIPRVDSTPDIKIPVYSFFHTRISLDRARTEFIKVKELTIELSMIENTAYRLATNINRTQKRSNALKNITIPHYTELSKSIQNALEEKEREEFTRLKVIKRRQTNQI